MKNPAIVVVAYNRLESFSRLLNSLKNAKYNEEVALILSIDKSNTNSISNLAEDFDWHYGEKKVIKHEKNLGLRNHILFCGNLTKEYESIILLEDDLCVSPYFYEYAKNAGDFYEKDERIAGIALYSQQYNMFTRFPFQPVIDKSDIYFLKIPESWGQIWTKNQWTKFYDWYNHYDKNNFSKSQVPDPVKNWSEHSWAKYFWLYMLETDKYFVFPRIAYSTQFGDAGTNVKIVSSETQVNLTLESKKIAFVTIDDSIAVYDEYYELLSEKLKVIKPEFQNFDFEVDINRLKPINTFKKEYLLTTRTIKDSVYSYGKFMKPVILNVVFDIPGSTIYFGKVKNLDPDLKANVSQKMKEYFFYYPMLTTKRVLWLAVMKILKKL